MLIKIENSKPVAYFDDEFATGELGSQQELVADLFQKQQQSHELAQRTPHQVQPNSIKKNDIRNKRETLAENNKSSSSVLFCLKKKPPNFCPYGEDLT